MGKLTKAKVLKALKEHKFKEKDLLKRAMELTNKFATCNIKTEILDEQQIIQLCSSFTNMNYAYKEDSDYEDNLPMIRWEV